MRTQIASVFLYLTHASLSASIDEVFQSIQSSNAAKLKKILADTKESLPEYINTPQPGSGQTPLMMSVLFGADEHVKLLLAEEAVDVTVPEKDGYTPMHGAGFQGRSEILKMLLADKRKIDPSARHSDGYTPLHRACWGKEQRHTMTVRTFIKDGGVAWDESTPDGRTCMEMTQNSGTQKWLKKWKENLDKQAKEEL